jgi:cytochrome P450
VLGHLTGNGLIYLEGEEHKYMKKRSLPLFSFRRIKDLYPSIWNHALRYAEALEVNVVQQSTESKQGGPSSGSLDLTHWSHKITSKVISTTVLGRDFKALNDTKFDTLMKLLNAFLEPDASMQLHLCLSVLFSPNRLKMILLRINKLIQETSAALKSICLQLVQENREAMKKGG